MAELSGITTAKGCLLLQAMAGVRLRRIRAAGAGKAPERRLSSAIRAAVPLLFPCSSHRGTTYRPRPWFYL